MKKRDTKVTLVKLSISRKRVAFWRDLGRLFGILTAVALVLAAIGATQYVICRNNVPPKNLEQCFRVKGADRPLKRRK